MSFSTYYLVEVNSNTYNNMREELDMLFLLEHFSLEDLVKAEEEHINYEYKNTDNIAESYYDIEEYIDDECIELWQILREK